VGWRFRKSFGVPGLRFNVSKTGFSLSLGARGFTTNIDLSGRRKKRVMHTVSWPGSGLSYRWWGRWFRGE